MELSRELSLSVKDRSIERGRSLAVSLVIARYYLRKSSRSLYSSGLQAPKVANDINLLSRLWRSCRPLERTISAQPEDEAQGKINKLDQCGEEAKEGC